MNTLSNTTASEDQTITDARALCLTDQAASVEQHIESLCDVIENLDSQLEDALAQISTLKSQLEDMSFEDH